jgi:uncharacterized protein
VAASAGLRGLFQLLLVVALAYVAFAAMMTLTQDRQIYLPMSVLVTTPAAHGLPYEEVWLMTEDGVRIHGWYLPAPDGARPDGRAPTLLFLHGNAGNISHRIASLRIFHELGLAVLIIDYRGYGRSDGRPDEEGLYLDALAGWRHLRDERGIAAGDIVVFGRSLGAAVAAWLAARKQPAGVILEAGFTSAADLGREIYPWLPVRLLLRAEYDTLSAVRSIDAPLLIVHSRDDEIVPFAHGRRLYEAAAGTRAMLELRGGHNDGFVRSGAEYRDGLSRFLDTLFR